MERDLGNVSTRYQDTSTSSSTDIGSVSSGTTRAVDRIINSSVIRRRVVEGRNDAIAAEKYVSPNLQVATNTNIGGLQEATNTNIGGRLEMGGETKKTPFIPSWYPQPIPTIFAAPTVEPLVPDEPAKANPIVMYAAIGIGAILIYKYFIK